MSGKAPVPEISASDLAAGLERGEPIQILDVRAASRVATGRIDMVPPERFHNLAGSQLLKRGDLPETGIDPTLPVVVVCGHGNSSRGAARHLNNLGAQARTLVGGMRSWMDLVVPRLLPPPAAVDRLIQFDRIGKGALGYLVVSGDEALVVDPPRDTSTYQEAAREAGARIVGVAETHVHADYVSGGSALARTLSVPYYLHPADAVYPYDGRPGSLAFTPLEDGGTISVGRCLLRARHTPGHTEGSLTYLIGGAAALTGDFIFIHSVGRPDLAGKTAEWSGRLWGSLVAARQEWPDGLLIYPAHYASDSERSSDRTVGARFGDLPPGNEALRFREEGAFRSWVAARSASFPDAYRRIKAVNIGLEAPDDATAEELDLGRNECALG